MIEIPDAGWVFATALAVHVLAGIVSVLAGALAAFAPKRRGRHPRWGTRYLYGLSVVFATAVVMSVLRWEHNRQLFGIAVVAFGLGLTGRWLRRHGSHRWMLWHGVAMAGSYVALLTGFYVDNGERLPVWSQLPHLTYWLLPTAIGVPLTWWALVRNGALSHSRPTASRPAGHTSRRR